MKLSILIPSLEIRASQLSKLIKNLESQATSDVEIISLVDNKQMSTGAKRQKLLEMSTGEYIVFIDDDDTVPEYYVSEMLKGCQTDADCMAINGYITTNGANRIDWRICKDYDNVTIIEKGRSVYLRKTNHITAVKRNLALQAGFPDKSLAEDKAYSDSLSRFLKTEHKIFLSMYHYDFQTANKQY